MTAWTVIPCAKNNLEVWVITDGQTVVMVMVSCKNMYLYIAVVQKRELLARFVFIRRPILRLIRIIPSLWCRLWAIGFFSPERLHHHQCIIIIITRWRISAYQQRVFPNWSINVILAFHQLAIVQTSPHMVNFPNKILTIKRKYYISFFSAASFPKRLNERNCISCHELHSWGHAKEIGDVLHRFSLSLQKENRFLEIACEKAFTNSLKRRGGVWGVGCVLCVCVCVCVVCVGCDGFVVCVGCVGCDNCGVCGL